MSIIYDALKKVQNNTDNNKAQEKIEIVKPVRAKTNPLLIYILVICLGLVLGNYAYNYFGLQKKSVPPLSAQPKAATPIPAPVKQIAPPAAITPDAPVASLSNSEPALVLNGVFFEQGEGYALINNKIVRVGDKIENAKVKEIALSGVELEFEGKVIKLLSPS